MTQDKKEQNSKCFAEKITKAYYDMKVQQAEYKCEAARYKAKYGVDWREDINDINRQA